jgi:hypothetical protein
MKKKNFLKKADTTEFDKYNCGNCSKFGTRWCPFIGTDNEPTAETRACEHFDKSYTVQVENVDYKGVSSITQEENLYKHYEAPEKLEVAQDNNEPFSHACGQCRKFGTVMCPYLEKNSKARSCQSFVIKSPDGEADIQMQNFDYNALTHDIPRENYHIHPETNTRKDMVEHPFAFKTVYPQPFRVAKDESKKTAQQQPYQYGVSEEQENALNTFLLDFRALKDSGLVKITIANIDQSHFEQSGSVSVEGVLAQYPEYSFYYKMNKEIAPARFMTIMDNESHKTMASQMLSPNEHVVDAIHKALHQVKLTASDKNSKKK